MCGKPGAWHEHLPYTVFKEFRKRISDNGLQRPFSEGITVHRIQLGEDTMGLEDPPENSAQCCSGQCLASGTPGSCHHFVPQDFLLELISCGRGSLCWSPDSIPSIWIPPATFSTLKTSTQVPNTNIHQGSFTTIRQGPNEAYIDFIYVKWSFLPNCPQAADILAFD